MHPPTTTLPISAFLARDSPRGSVPGTCGVCGITSDGQYLRRDVLPNAGSNITVLFPHNTPTICAACTALWRAPKTWHRSIFAITGQVWFPLIAESEYVSPLRPLWRDLFLRTDLESVPRVCVLTTDPKKRVWPHARISCGPCMLLYLHNPSGGQSGLRQVTWPLLRDMVIGLESIYQHGFFKAELRTGLLTAPWALLHSVGIQRCARWEAQLQSWRRQPEFLPALIAAKKEKSWSRC